MVRATASPRTGEGSSGAPRVPEHTGSGESLPSNAETYAFAKIYTGSDYIPHSYIVPSPEQVQAFQHMTRKLTPGDYTRLSDGPDKPDVVVTPQDTQLFRRAYNAQPWLLNHSQSKVSDEVSRKMSMRQMDRLRRTGFYMGLEADEIKAVARDFRRFRFANGLWLPSKRGAAFEEFKNYHAKRLSLDDQMRRLPLAGRLPREVSQPVGAPAQRKSFAAAAVLTATVMKSRRAFGNVANNLRNGRHKQFWTQEVQLAREQGRAAGAYIVQRERRKKVIGAGLAAAALVSAVAWGLYERYDSERSSAATTSQTTENPTPSPGQSPPNAPNTPPSPWPTPGRPPMSPAPPVPPPPAPAPAETVQATPYGGAYHTYWAVAEKQVNAALGSSAYNRLTELQRLQAVDAVKDELLVRNGKTEASAHYLQVGETIKLITPTELTAAIHEYAKAA